MLTRDDYFYAVVRIPGCGLHPVTTMSIEPMQYARLCAKAGGSKKLHGLFREEAQRLREASPDRVRGLSKGVVAGVKALLP